MQHYFCFLQGDVEGYQVILVWSGIPQQDDLCISPVTAIQNT